MTEEFLTRAINPLKGQDLQAFERLAALGNVNRNRGLAESTPKSVPQHVSDATCQYLCSLRHFSAAVAGVLLLSTGAAASTEPSRPFVCPEALRSLYAGSTCVEQERVADFYEPITFEWDEDDFEVSNAVQQYCESAYADR